MLLPHNLYSYASITRGRSVGPPVVVNIDICGYLGFFSISFVWIIWVQYATDNLSGQQLEFVTMASVDISNNSELLGKQ